MSALTFKKQNLPFLLSGTSQLTVETGDVKLNKKLDETSASVFSTSVSGSGGSDGTLGQGGTVNVKVSASANASLTPVFSGTGGAVAKILTTYGVDGFFRMEIPIRSSSRSKPVRRRARQLQRSSTMRRSKGARRWRRASARRTPISRRSTKSCRSRNCSRRTSRR